MGYTSISAFVVDQIFGFQTANLIRGNNLAGLGALRPGGLGGSSSVGLQTASYLEVEGRKRIRLDGTETSGLTRQARIWYRTLAVATSVIWRVQNLTDVTTLAQGTIYSADTLVQEEVISVTPPTGEKEYALELQGGNANNPIFGWGDIEHYL